MVATIPPVLIEKPTPSMPLRYGLLQAAFGPFDLPVHARNGGLRYVTSLCAEGFGYEIECIGSQDSKASEFSLGTTTVTGLPFIIAATVTCGAVGFTYDEQRAFVMERLRGVEQSMLEEIFSTSTFGQAPGLVAADGITTVTGAGDSVANVLSELERARYCGFTGNTAQYGPPGTLHVAIPVLNALKEAHLIEFGADNKWHTAMGTVVSAGCYANNNPAGAAPADGVFWMYLTGQTAIWRTPDPEVQVAPVEGSLNRTTNQMMMLAEREYVVTYECGGFAKAVTLWT
jgi:hypothetical protein